MKNYGNVQSKKLRRPLLKDVAERARVSVGLASRVLRNTGSFSEASRSRVLNAAEELSYTPDAVARSLKQRRTKAFGVLISTIMSHFFAPVVRAIEDVASKSGYAVTLCNTDYDPDKEQSYLSALYERGVDGVIVCASPGNDAYLKKIARAGIPVVLVFRKVPGLDAPRITTDNADSARRAVSHLIELGHRRIATITGIRGVQSSAERLAGYRQALLEAGIALRDELVVDGLYDEEASFEGTRRLLDLEDRPTALLTCAETMTIGALYAVKEAGLTVPADISIVGYGDPSWAALLTPPLTVVRHPHYQMGLLAAQTLIGLVEGRGGDDKTTKQEIVLKSSLIVRESCRSPGGVAGSAENAG